MGSSSVEITLTGISEGDPTTQLSAAAGNLVSEATIADDDFVDVVIGNVDLTAAEGHDDDASMTFALAGQPGSDVTLSFSGDSQCTVAPASMTFTTSNYALAQTLTISAVNDDVVEGTHSCQPTVALSSPDSRYDGLSVALASVTIVDDLVDQIRDPLEEILQQEFAQTVAAQSLRFSDMAKGALERLQSGIAEGACGTLSHFDVDGQAKLDASGLNSSGSFGGDHYNSLTGVRTIVSGEFSLAGSDEIDTQGMLQFAIQKEKARGANDLQGLFWGGYVSRSRVTSQVDGHINGIGLNAGVYGAHAYANGLFVDYAVAGSVGNHRYNLTFSDPAAPILAQGDYSYAALFASAAVSGAAEYDTFTLKPRVGLDLGYAVASDPSVSATQLGVTDIGTLSLDPVHGARLFAEMAFVFDNSSTPVQGLRSIEIAPRLFCENGFSSTSTGCGAGGYVKFTSSSVPMGVDLGVTIDVEDANGVRRARLDFSHERRILSGVGAVVTRFGADQNGQAMVNMSAGIEF